MLIGLNYTHIELGEGKRLLPNYLYLLPAEVWPENTLYDESTLESLFQQIDDGTLHTLLSSGESDELFTDPLLRKIVEVAYPYEVGLKCLQEDIPDDLERNQQLIGLFNDFFHIDYEEELDRYCAHCKSEDLRSRSDEEKSWVYQDINIATQLFIDFVVALLQDQGYTKEVEQYTTFAQQKLHIDYQEGISGMTTEKDGDIYIKVGNNTTITLYHELAHFTNRFFRYHYYEPSEVCFDNYTMTSEGFANFVAYHLHHQIMNKDIGALEDMSTQKLFFSKYIDIYAALRQYGSNKREDNFAIVHEQMKLFEGDLLTDAKAKFYYERFYKFFHYDQHTYFYPKEMMYYLGYERIRELFKTNTHKKQLLTSLFLAKICL